MLLIAPRFFSGSYILQATIISLFTVDSGFVIWPLPISITFSPTPLSPYINLCIHTCCASERRISFHFLNMQVPECLLIIWNVNGSQCKAVQWMNTWFFISPHITDAMTVFSLTLLSQVLTIFALSLNALF